MHTSHFRYIKYWVFAVLALLFITNSAWAATPLPIDKAFQLTAATQKSQINLHWKLAKNIHLYKDRFAFTIISPSDAHIQTPIDYPKGITTTDEIFGTYQVYKNCVTIPLAITGNTNKPISLSVHFQGCSSDGFCYPPVTKTLSLSFNQATTNNTNSESEQTHIFSILKNQPLWIILFTFLGLGLLLSFTPCVLPMIPVLSGIILGQKNITTLRAFLLSLTYVLAMSFTYAIAGIAISLMGKNIQLFLQQPIFIIVLTIIFILLALSLFANISINLPESWQSKLANISQQQTSGTYIGVAVMGVIATLILSPCVTPPLVGTLLFIAQTGNAVLGGLALFTLGLGMGIPLLIIGTFGTRYLPKRGYWMNTVKTIFAFLLLGVAVSLINRILPNDFHLLLWSLWLISFGIFIGGFFQQHSTVWIRWIRYLLGIACIAVSAMLFIHALHNGSFRSKTSKAQTHMIGSTPVHPVSNIKELNHYLAIAKRDHKPLMLDFYADWCASCKELEATTFQNQHIQRSLSHFILVQADITQNTKEDQAFMKIFNVIAPPTMVFFNAQGVELKQRRIVGFIDAKKLCHHLAIVSSLSAGC